MNLQNLILSRDALKEAIEKLQSEGDALAKSPNRTLLAVVELNVKLAKTRQSFESVQHKINEVLCRKE